MNIYCHKNHGLHGIIQHRFYTTQIPSKNYQVITEIHLSDKTLQYNTHTLNLLYVTGFVKTDRIVTTAEIQFNV